MNVNQAIPLGLILNELIINAYKHAFSDGEGGKIKIQLQKEGEQVFAQVSDNGIGIPEEVDHQAPKKLGYTIIHTLKEQLNADLTVESGSEGTTVKVLFKHQKPMGSASNIQRDII